MIFQDPQFASFLDDSLSPEIDALVATGAFAKAKGQLQKLIPEVTAPITSVAAIQAERLRRIQHDYNLGEIEMLAALRQSIPDITTNDLQRWRDAGYLDYRMIDGQVCYFCRAASNCI